MAESNARFLRKLALLAKIETDYGVDAVPTGMANAIQASNVTLTPIEGVEISRELLLPYLGHQGIILSGEYTLIEFDVEVAGAGAAGDVPAYGPLLRMGGMHQTIVEVATVPTQVEYNPVSGGFEAGSIYYNLDGVRHILLGARGTVTVPFVPSQIPRYRFRILGLKGTIADAALPTVDLTAFIKPVPVNKANTTMALHGWTAIAESLELQLGNVVEPRMLSRSRSPTARRSALRSSRPRRSRPRTGSRWRAAPAASWPSSTALWRAISSRWTHRPCRSDDPPRAARRASPTILCRSCCCPTKAMMS
jgi:hypothetical protein